MTKKEKLLAAIRGEIPDVVSVALLIHNRFAHKVLGSYDLEAVFELHKMIGSVFNVALSNKDLRKGFTFFLL